MIHARKIGGFTILEVIVAIGIITIGLVGTLPMLSFAVKSNVASKNRGVAIYLADKQIEKIKSWPIYHRLSDVENSSIGGVHGIERFKPAGDGSMLGHGFWEGVEGDYECPVGANYCTEKIIKMNWWETKFERTTWIIKNGWTGTGQYRCDGVRFASNESGAKIFNEGFIYPSVQSGSPHFDTNNLKYNGITEDYKQPSLNHSDRLLEYDPKSADCIDQGKEYRGADFTLIRVEVLWTDIFSRGEEKKIVRDLFVRGY